MKKCEQCEKLNEEQAIFCEECGSSFEKIKGNEPAKEKTVAEKTVEEKPTRVPALQAPLTKKQKVVRGSIAAAVLLLAGSYAFGKSYYSEEKQIDRHIETLHTGDAKKIAAILKTDDLNFDMNEKNIKPFSDYLKQNKEYMKQLTQTLKNSHGGHDNGMAVYAAQKGKIFFLYDNYDLVLNTIYADVSSNLKDVELLMNDQELGKTKEADETIAIGPLAPGEYDFAARTTTGKFPLETKTTVSLMDFYGNQHVDLSLYGVEFSVESNVADADVYLNDEKIGTLEEGIGSFGPVAFQANSKVVLKKEYSFGTVEEEQDFEEYDQRYYIDFDTLSDNDAEYFLNSMYSYAGSLTSSDSTYTQSSLEEMMVNGKENDVYKTFVNKGKKIREDEDTSRVYYEVELESVNQTEQNKFEVEYTLVAETAYSYSADKENQTDRLPFKAVLVTEEVDGYTETRLESSSLKEK